MASKKGIIIFNELRKEQKSVEGALKSELRKKNQLREK